MVTGFIFVSGMSVGVCASRNYDGSNILTAESMKKASRFVCFCDSFNIPLLTLVECSEFEKSVDSLKEMSTLAFSYSSSTNAKVTVMIEDMSKLPFIIMGSKSLGSDIVIAIERNEGDEMIAEAAMYGEVDDIIDLSEIRKRICAAFEMLNSKSTLPFAKKKSNYTIRLHHAKRILLQSRDQRGRFCSQRLDHGQRGGIDEDRVHRPAWSPSRLQRHHR